MMTSSLWIVGFLLISLTGIHGLDHFPEHFVVAERNDTSPITLTCRTESDGPVTWKLEDEVLDFEADTENDGKSLIVSEVDTPMLGEYSCWRRGQKLSSTHLLLEAGGDENIDSLLTCRAKSYDCNFSCRWADSTYTAVRLGLGSECTTGQKACNWVSGSDELQDQGYQFVLSHSLSPYAEESTRLEVTVEAISSLHFLRKTKLFYLRDIVVPDRPHIVRCQEVDQKLNVTIEPPPSWSTPHSFFSLEHEIEYVFRDDGRTERSSSTLIPSRISKLRVRSRDSLVLSPWSQWTSWKNVRTGKRNSCRCKQGENFCCKKSSESFNHCKKSKRNKKLPMQNEVKHHEKEEVLQKHSLTEETWK